jgi:CheY-like chemotaxis protein
MGGIELMEELQKRKIKVKVIASSGYVNGANRKRGIFDGFTSKPYEVVELLTLVKNVLST